MSLSRTEPRPAAKAGARPLSGPARPEAALPRVTIAVFLSLAAIATLLGLVLVALRQPWFMWGAALFAVLMAVGNAYGVSRRRATSDVIRTEARLRRLLTPPRRFRPTREGWWFMAITVFVGIAAMNTGNNLLYLLLGMLLSLILASGVLSESSLRGVSVTRHPPHAPQAGAPALVGITIHNTKRRQPSFSIEVEDLVHGQVLDKRCWFLKVPPGRVQRTAYRHHFPRRGLYRFSGLRLSTRFPFALFRKSRDLAEPAEVVVLPRLHPIDRPPLPLRGFAGDDPQGHLSRSGEFWGLRELRDGDDQRDVHWPQTAKRGRLMVREHEREEARRVTLFLDNALPGGAACRDEQQLAGLERAVSLCASIAAWYVERGFAARLIARGEASPWTVGKGPLERLLRQLALLPTVEGSVPFAGSPEPGVESLCVVHGASSAPAGLGRVLAA